MKIGGSPTPGSAPDPYNMLQEALREVPVTSEWLILSPVIILLHLYLICMIELHAGADNKITV